MTADEGGRANALSRVWCVYEIFHTVLHGSATFKVLMSEAEVTRFLSMLEDNWLLPFNVFARIDIRKAESFKAKDKERIMAHVESDDGPGAKVCC